jgi:hypothetical protein
LSLNVALKLERLLLFFVLNLLLRLGDGIFTTEVLKLDFGYRSECAPSKHFVVFVFVLVFNALLRVQINENWV